MAICPLVTKYKGYEAHIEYDDEDKIYIGKLFGIKDLIIFEGESITELEEMFKQAVDNYLEFCKEVGKEPDKPKSEV